MVDVRKEESLTAFLMFAYSFLAMPAYNIIKPLTRSKFITARRRQPSVRAAGRRLHHRHPDDRATRG